MRKIEIPVSGDVIRRLADDPHSSMKETLGAKLNGAILMLVSALIEEGISVEQIKEALDFLDPDFLKGVIDKLPEVAGKSS